MTNFHVVCKNNSNSCWYGNYKYIGIGSNCFKLYSTDKKGNKLLKITIDFDEILEVSYTPDELKNCKVYTDYDKLLEFDTFFKEKNRAKQLSIFD